MAGLIYSWFTIEINKNILILIGIILLVMPYLRYRLFDLFSFRMLCFVSILIWIVIFNHKAESPTFIIAVTGIAIWYFSGVRSRVDTVLIIICFILTCLSPTDLFPRSIRNNIVVPFVLKALPCIVIWIRLTIYLLSCPKERINQDYKLIV